MVAKRGFPLEYGDRAVRTQEISQRDAGYATANDRNIDSFGFRQEALPIFRPDVGGFLQIRTTFF
jgi:hypothetical protein